MTNVVLFKNKTREAEQGARCGAFRWLAKINYPSGEFKSVVFDEFEELGEFMESGPDWTGCRIEIRHYQAAEKSA